MTVPAPTFSVVIPVYNRAGQLRSALTSVLAQTFQDFEIVVVDDGSNDDPMQVANKLNDGRIRVIRRTNGGGSAARNTGIDAATGAYIAFLDSDDTFVVDHLACANDYLSGHPHDIAYAPVVLDRGNGVVLIKPARGFSSGEHMAEYLFCSRGWVPTSTICVPRSLAFRIRYDETIRYGQDADFAIRLAETGVKFHFIDRPKARVADHNDPSRLSVARRVENIEAWLNTMKARMPGRAYHAFRGWHLARALSQSGQPWRAWGYCVQAIARGAYSPKVASAVILQVVLPAKTYRWIADHLAYPVERLLNPQLTMAPNSTIE